MRKSVAVILLLTVLALGTSCGTKVEGTWYSDYPADGTLTFNEDGTYIGGGWLNTGRYSVEGDKIILTGLLDGTKTLHIKKENSATVLCFDDGLYPHTFYANEELAKEKIEQRKKDEAKEQERLLGELLPRIMGYWVSDKRGPLELSDTKECYYFNGSDCYVGTYECELKLDWQEKPQEIILKVTLKDGKTETWSVDPDGTQLQNRVGKYRKAERIEQWKEDMLIGEWTRSGVTYVFTEGTCTRKASFEKPTTWRYELEGNVLRRLLDEGLWVEEICLMRVDGEVTLVVTYTRPHVDGGNYTIWETLTKSD
jgi:hypothetical protein